MNTNYKSVVLSISLFFALSVSISAAPADLDFSFGNAGIVISGGNDSYTLGGANAMAVQADGKIVVAGTSSLTGGTRIGFGVVRYNTNGTLDNSFGDGGIVRTQVYNFYDYPADVAIQADGKIVVVGYAVTSDNGIYDIAVVRYNPNGTLDTSFNGTGKIVTSIGSYSDAANSVAIQPDGKIVVAGIGRTGSPNYEDFAVVRYNTNGSLDTTFNGTGIVLTPLALFDFARAVAIQTDGKIVVAGGVSDGTTINYFGVVRYNTDGSLDTTFNGTGKVLTPVGNIGGPVSAVIQTNGKIVVAGYSSNPTVIRYNSDGSLDTTFGGTGKIIIPTSSIGVESLALQADGKIVLAGYSDSYSGHGYAVVRLNPGGSLDAAFNGSGMAVTTISGNDYGYAAAIQADGKIVVAGITQQPDGYFDIAIIRYQGNSNLNIRSRFDFDGDGKADVSVFRPSDRIWYLNQSANGFSATQFGVSTDRITPADFDADGKTDISVYRDGIWYWLASSNNSFNARQFGIASDIPVPDDYTGDGRDELAVYRNGVWWIQSLSNNYTVAIQFGVGSDKPVPADYDGDGRADPAVYRGSGEWHLNRSLQGYAAVNFGLATDKPTAGDYDGDGRADQAVYRDGVWYLLQSTNGFAAFPFGISSDIPAPADYDGDGRTDAAVFRDGAWWLRRSANGISTQQFGLAGDKPAPAAFLP